MNIPPFHHNNVTIANTSVIICCAVMLCLNSSSINKTINGIIRDIKINKTENKMIEFTANSIFTYHDSIAKTSRTISPNEYFPTQKEAEKDSVYYRKQIRKHIKDNKEKYIKQKQSKNRIYFYLDTNAINNDQQLTNKVASYRNAVRHLNIRRSIIRHR